MDLQIGDIVEIKRVGHYLRTNLREGSATYIGKLLNGVEYPEEVIFFYYGVGVTEFGKVPTKSKTDRYIFERVENKKGNFRDYIILPDRGNNLCCVTKLKL